MTAAYELEVRRYCPKAVIVFDLFHVIAKFGREVIDRVRVDEANRLRKEPNARHVVKSAGWLPRRRLFLSEDPGGLPRYSLKNQKKGEGPKPLPVSREVESDQGQGVGSAEICASRPTFSLALLVVKAGGPV